MELFIATHYAAVLSTDWASSIKDIVVCFLSIHQLEAVWAAKWVAVTVQRLIWIKKKEKIGFTLGSTVNEREKWK